MIRFIIYVKWKSITLYLKELNNFFVFVPLEMLSMVLKIQPRGNQIYIPGSRGGCTGPISSSREKTKSEQK